MSLQAKDTILYQGVKHMIKFTHPIGETSGSLSPLGVLKERLGVSLSPIHANTGNYRGYTCGWEVDDNTLYLTRFTSNSYRIYTFDQFMGITPPDEENALSGEKLYPSDEVRIKADWFSGVIVAYRYRAKHEDELNGWDLVFDNGILTNAAERFVSAPKRLRDYLEEDEESDRINGCVV